MNWETILRVITNPIVITVITAVAGVAIKGFMKYKKAFEELVDVPRRVLAARDKNSPGGKVITAEEYAAIGKEIVELVEAISPLVAKKGTTNA